MLQLMVAAQTAAATAKLTDAGMSNILLPYSGKQNGLSLWSIGSTRSFGLIGCRFETQLDTQEKTCRVYFFGHFSDVFLLNRL